MTREETAKKIETIFQQSGCEGFYQTDELLSLIPEVLEGFIGEDEDWKKLKPDFTHHTNVWWEQYANTRNDLRQELRENIKEWKGK